MARKTAATLSAPTPVRKGTYADYPGCLPQYKWLVELAMKSPEVMFNLPTVTGPSYCKCCGAAYNRKDFAAHVQEHVAQLKLTKTIRVDVKVDPVVTKIDVQMKIPAVFDEEMMLTIATSLSERKDELGLTWGDETWEEIAADISGEIEKDTFEGRGPTPILCDDCAI
jgi:hypothetical protein